MSYALQFNTSDTLAATLNSGATSTTLTTGNFGTPTGTQLYVVDYDVPAKAEIISASVATTAVTSITRGLTGGASGTTDHAIGAKIASIFVPQHYAQLGGLADSSAWTSWTPTYTASSGTWTTVTTTYAKYFQVGKLVWFQINASGTTSSTPNELRFTLPVTAASSSMSFTAGATDSGAFQAGIGYSSSTTVVSVRQYNNANYSAGAGREIRCSGCYEAA